MGMSGKSPVLNIPYPITGDIPVGSDYLAQITIIENYLRSSILGNGTTRVFSEGVYSVTLDAVDNATVKLSGSPAITAILNGSFVSYSGTLSWPPLIIGQIYYLYLEATASLPSNPAAVITVESTIPETSSSYLLLATLDNTIPGSPVLNTSPPGKPIGANLFALLNSPTNPFGTTLTQANAIITTSLTVNLGGNSTVAINQSNAAATLPALTIQQNNLNLPHIKGTVDIRLGDSRTPAAGYPLSDILYFTLPFNYTSILGTLYHIALRDPVTLPSGATLATDARTGNYFSATLTSAATLSNPLNSSDGQRITWRFRQDGVGGRVLTLDTAFRVPNSAPPVVLSTAANAVDYLIAEYNLADAKWDVLAFIAASSNVSPTLYLKETTPGAYPYNVLTTDCVILVDTTSARSIVLPAPATVGANKPFWIVDATGTASANNVTISVSGGANIDGASTHVIKINRDVVLVISRATDYVRLSPRLDAITGNVTVTGNLFGSRVQTDFTNQASATPTLSITTTVDRCTFVGSTTATLPTAASYGKGIKIVKGASSVSGTLTVTANGAETIDGVSSVVVNANGGVVRLYCDGVSAWDLV